MQKAVTFGVLALAFASAAHAQNMNMQSIFNTVREIAGAAAQTQLPSLPSPEPSRPSLESGSASPPAVLLFRTKQDFLDAARHGDFAGYAKTGPHPAGRTTDVMNSLAWILDQDYQTPVPNWDGRNRYAGGHSNDYCIVSEVKEQMHGLLQAVTEDRVQSLSNQPPDFQSNHLTDQQSAIDSAIRTLRNVCYQTVFGTQKPYPFIDSYIALMREYAAATDAYVDERRTQLKAQYQQEVAQKRAADEQRAESDRRQQAARRAQEQRQIEADHQRIEEQERKAKERERNRIAG